MNYLKKTHFIIFTLLVLLLVSCQTQDTKEENNNVEQNKQETSTNWNDEVIYHVMQRSFYDSDGDLHGDLNGFIEKLDYLEELGVTTILFTPLYASDFYHNYFPTDYEKIDEEYGTKEDYIRFVKEVHQRDMKFLMDMETQYAQNGHIWFDDSYKNPKSKYSDYIYYSDSLNEYPGQIFMKLKSPLKEFNAFPDKKLNIVYLDLNHPKVKKYMIDFYKYWVDPNGDGNFDDGVDGFRIDHIMDDLDDKGVFMNMYQDFWKPIFKECRKINPELFIVGEQADWNEYGENMMNESGANAAFNFQLLFAISDEEGVSDMYKENNLKDIVTKPERVHKVVAEVDKRFEDNQYVINFLENHDTNRWASLLQENQGQMRVTAVLNILLPGIPSIYYGQELGLTGTVKDWGSDINHVPVREAFPWTSNPDDKGTALFYKDSKKMWKVSIHNSEKLKDFALTTQRKDLNSLWNHYHTLISLRKKYAAFRQGDYKPLNTGNDNIIAFERVHKQQKLIVIANLSDTTQTIAESLLKNGKMIAGKIEGKNKLSPYQFIILEHQ